MKTFTTLNITYDTFEEGDHGELFEGETCLDITMESGRAELLLAGFDMTPSRLQDFKSCMEYCHMFWDIEAMLTIAEKLKGRSYRRSSIKHIEIVDLSNRFECIDGIMYPMETEEGWAI